MKAFVSKNHQFFLRDKNFFLNQLFSTFRYWFEIKKNSDRRFILIVYGGIIIFVLFCSTFKVHSQQSAIFSQSMFNQLTINPAYAGSSEVVNLFGTSRQQWIGLDGHSKTTVFGFDAPINMFKSEAGLGLNFSNDQIGFSEEIVVNLSGSLKYRLQTGTINVGLNFGIINHVLKPEWEVPTSDYHSADDNLLVDSEQSASVFDMGIGTFYTCEKWFGGLSLTHLFNPAPKFDDSYFYYLKRTMYIFGGYSYSLQNRPIEFRPFAMIVTDGVSIQSDIHLQGVYKKRFWGGLGYRFGDAIILDAGIELKNGLRLGYSYDVATSGAISDNGGSHEVTIGYKFILGIDKKSKGYKSVRYL